MVHLPTTMVSGLRLFAWVGFVLLSSKTALSSDAILVEFASKNCEYCVAMQPVTQQLTMEGIAIRHVDVDTEPALAVRYSVRHLPTYVIISGGKEAARLVGKQPIEMVRQALAASQAVHLTPTNAPAPRNAPATHSASVDQAPPVNQAIDAAPPQDAFSTGAPLTRLASVEGTSGSGNSVAGNSPNLPTSALSIATNTAETAIDRAAQATVRLRIFEENGVGFGIGTGTVIDARAGEYLVLTCGHLFRDSNGKGRVEIDVFQGDKSVTVPGQIVDYDAEDRDVGLVSMRTDLRITPVPVLPNNDSVRNGDSVFSFGCDRGANPSRRDTRITGIDKYNQHLKLSNLEIAGAPVIGRSGGGLFDKQGRLIGVCNAADYNDDIGIYAGPGEVYWQLGRVGMETLASATLDAGNLPVNDVALVAQNFDINRQTASSGHLASPHVLGAEPSNTMGPATVATAANADGELILIYRDRTQPSAPAQVRVIERPTSDLLELLRR